MYELGSKQCAKGLYQFHVRRVGVDFAVDRHSLDAELLSGANDATRDFTSAQWFQQKHNTIEESTYLFAMRILSK